MKDQERKRLEPKVKEEPSNPTTASSGLGAVH
jgi:hypothetical protein